VTRERWAQVERVLDAVLDREPREWDAMIAELCGSDAELRAEVESLVARHGPVQRFLETPAVPAVVAGWGGFADDAASGETSDASTAKASRATDPLLGSSIGHYRIEELLGGGGMGIVYRARDTRLERDVALKFLPPHLGLDPKAKSRFLREARAAAALDHPNICTVHEIGEAADGRLFIAMACYQGRVLKERIAEGPLAVEEAVAIAIGIAHGLAAAHARGVVHRDVKPANVMLTADGGVKLLDFGLAKLADVTLTQSGITPGTVPYMSPEQLRGEDVDARSDLWSLGVVLYEMLSGERPFRGRHEAAVMRAILQDEPQPLGASTSEAMPSVPAIVSRLLAKDPVERYPTARHLLADLESVRALAPRVPAPKAARRPSSDSSGRAPAVVRRRRRLLEYVRRARSSKRAMAFATLLVMTVAGLVAASRFASRPTEIRRIAVLPLANLTGDPDLEYFVDGVHYALSSELAKIGALTVYSRQSVLRYRGSDRPLPEIARELGVDALLEGAVFKSGDSVRITVHLLRARPEQQMLEATHDGLLSHALVLHNVVAREIADSVHARLAPAEARERRAAKRVVDPAADKAFLAGLYHLERSLKGQLITGPEQAEVLDSAIHHFKKAIALEPEWSAPHARISTAYRLRSTHFTEDTAAEYDRRAKAEALRGIELDETDAEAHASLASVLLFRDRDWVGAGRAIRRSLELDPYARAMTAASYMTAAGRHDEAIPLWRKAEARYPLSEQLKSWAVMAYACAGFHDEAIARARELTDRMTRSGRTGVPGDSTWLLNFLAYEHSMKGEHVEAIAAAEALVARDAKPESRIALAFVYARAGRRDAARALAERLEAEARPRGRPWRPAELYAALGDTQRALDMVEAATKERRPEANFRCSITYRVLEHEPRMRGLARSLGFPSSD
jgi:serine/threonine-protein kinase